MDAEFKKLLAGGKWAETGDRADPGSSNISPQLARTTGWPSSYSQSDGNTPDRRRMNQQFRELTGGAFEVRMGVSPYDAAVNYPLDAITQVQGRLFRAKVANGPGTSNATEPVSDTNEAVWERVSGSVTIPDAPREALFDNSELNALSLRWKNGRDGGERIKTYQFQYRTLGNDIWLPSTPITLNYAQHKLTGLTSGHRIVVRIKAVSDEGESVWYITDENAANALVVGNVPSGGNALGLIGEPGDSRVRLTWNLPTSDGGFPILRYRLQWRTASETFGALNETTIGAPSRISTITGLTNGTLHYFRVAAENREGQGAWSNIAAATPSAAVQLAVQPFLNMPSTTRSGSIITAAARWTNSATAPTATPTSAKWQSRAGTSGVWSTSSHQGLTGFTITNAPADQIYQIRFRLITSLGETGWSDAATVASAVNKATAPGAPSVSVSASFRGDVPGSSERNYTIVVRWGAPNNGGRPIDVYNVRLNWNAGTTRSVSQTRSRNSRSASFIITVPPGTRFTAYVSANNGVGQGAWGSAITTAS